jgi:alginate O-acetyltransferase complex protein AlgI
MKRTRFLAWGAFVAGVLSVERLAAHEPPLHRMLALIAFSLFMMKLIVIAEARALGMGSLSLGRFGGFALGGFGMDPRPFAAAKEAPLPGAVPLIRRGLAQAALGAWLVLLAKAAWATTGSRLLATLLLLPGLSLLVHFGLCNVLAGLWRRHGVACYALFRAPLVSESLGEFWARRWNVAFSEMTAIAVYRPLAARFGRAPAVMAGLAVSGVLHERASSVPVRAGYGLPLGYFLGHGALVHVERALASSGFVLGGWVGRAWAVLWVLAPLPLLFHPPFLAGVVWPLVGIPSGG